MHGPAERLGAWGCQEWSFHLLRLLSTALTVPMILLVVATLRLAAPDSPTTAAVGGLIPALLPSHVVVSAMFNNDALVNLLIVAATYLVVLAVRTGDAAAIAKAAVVAGIATTAKLSGFFLFGLILVALVVRRDLGPGLLRPGAARRWLAAAGACSILPLLVLARNLLEWGDSFAVAALEQNLVKLVAVGWSPVQGDPVRYYAIEMPELFANSFMVAYGAVNFRFTGAYDLGRWGPRIVLAGLVLSLLLRSVWRRIDRRALLVLAAGVALFFTTYAYPGYRYRWLQVRYFFNQFPLIALVSAVGIETLWAGARRLGLPAPDRALVAIVYVFLVGLDLLVLWAGVIPHVYHYVGAAG
jgi:Dolichyl-phosphate-mannose-protein mannosyltransferase